MLKTGWMELLAGFGVDQALSLQAYDEVAGRYRESHRTYHNLTHIGEMLEVVDEFGGAADNVSAVQLAVWLHDVIYDSTASDNEERSADFATELLTRLNIPLVDDVHRLILATKTHANPENDPDTQLLLDADLAILGASTERYAAYAEAIRKEYVWVPDEQYRSGRTNVLTHFLERERIYGLEPMRVRLEQQARQNMTHELELLRGLPGGTRTDE
jgi:predicted metal-dependent HD superfamily phosphohydrolase